MDRLAAMLADGAASNNNPRYTDSDDFSISDDVSEGSGLSGAYVNNARDSAAPSRGREQGAEEEQVEAVRYDVQGMMNFLAAGSGLNPRGRNLNYTLGSDEWPTLWSLALTAIGGRSNLPASARALSPQGKASTAQLSELESPKKTSAFEFTPLARENFDDTLANFAVKQRPYSAGAPLPPTLNRYADPEHPLAIDRLEREGTIEPPRPSSTRVSVPLRLLDCDLLDQALRRTMSRSLDDDQDLKRTFGEINESLRNEQRAKQDAIKKAKKVGFAATTQAGSVDPAAQETLPLMGSKLMMHKRMQYTKPKALLKQMYDRMKATGFLKNQSLVSRVLRFII